MNSSESLINGIVTEYETTFGDGTVIGEIQMLIQALKDNKPVLDLLENSRGSFSTIFSPFHAGKIVNGDMPLQNPDLPKALINFTKRAAVVESLIDELPAKGIEPDDSTKIALLQALEDFLGHFPSKEEVLSWKS